MSDVVTQNALEEMARRLGREVNPCLDDLFPSPDPEPAPTAPIQGTIYAIQADAVRRIKVGFTTREPGRRLAGLQVGSPVRLRIRATWPGTLAEERALHRRLDRFHVLGEWYREDVWAELVAIMEGRA